eukprot:gnl/TRDRNA2_/TRDRNA2_60925_c0_seq1.p1 gnl/TRDRNA2_/TRDRNA2_60925_c0~~gnl/TRDRNA2_/TRDRNA2_60925_c0_seq1.p1  ORF type:complete len:401 (+),score=67.64 gnl/TRDRNA2_/TRDRNA2_60925_c0_seq1:69-1271(+)
MASQADGRCSPPFGTSSDEISKTVDVPWLPKRRRHPDSSSSQYVGAAGVGRYRTEAWARPAIRRSRSASCKMHLQASSAASEADADDNDDEQAVSHTRSSSQPPVARLQSAGTPRELGMAMQAWGVLPGIDDSWQCRRRQRDGQAYRNVVRDRSADSLMSPRIWAARPGSGFTDELLALERDALLLELRRSPSPAPRRGRSCGRWKPAALVRSKSAFASLSDTSTCTGEDLDEASFSSGTSSTFFIPIADNDDGTWSRSPIEDKQLPSSVTEILASEAAALRHAMSAMQAMSVEDELSPRPEKCRLLPQVPELPCFEEKAPMQKNRLRHQRSVPMWQTAHIREPPVSRQSPPAAPRQPKKRAVISRAGASARHPHYGLSLRQRVAAEKESRVNAPAQGGR